MKVIYKYFFICLLLIVCGVCDAKEVTLREPPKTMAGQYIKELLQLSYQKLGYDISWKTHNSVQELDLSVQGRLSGAIIRYPIIEEDHPKLIRVPFPILHFSLLKVSDRERCGFCFNDNITSVAYVKGTVVSEKFANSLRPEIRKFPLSAANKLNELILKRRVDTLLIMDFQIDPVIYQNPNFIIEQVKADQAYHYLSPSMEHLKKPLNDVFELFEQDGTLTKLRNKYKISPLVKPQQKKSSLNAVSDNWPGYTNIDGSGVYWHLLKTIYNQDFDLKTDELIWQRAVDVFKNQKADILVGAYLRDGLENYLYSTYHIDYEYALYAFAHQQKILDDFANKATYISACIVTKSQTIKYVKFLPQENIVQTSLENCSALFEQQKVDIVIEYDYNLAPKLVNFPRLLLKTAEPLFAVFQNTPQGNYLKQHFDAEIVNLAREKKLQAIYETDENFKRANID